MKPIKSSFASCATLCLLVAGAAAQSGSVTGTVTDKTTGKPAAGDLVVLVDGQTGMSEAAPAKTDAQGRYSLKEPAGGPYLVRVMHQGVGYFIAAAQGDAAGDVAVYDVATRIKEVSVEADIFELESGNGQLHVTQRYFIQNTSSPPRTQWSRHTFTIVLPPEATIKGAAAEQPNGLPTSVTLHANGPKGRYTFSLPIQPDEAGKDTLIGIEYTVPYNGNGFAFHPQVSMPTQSLGVLLPKSMSFTAAGNSQFQPAPGDPAVQTFLARNLVPGQTLAFTVSGEGSMPQDAQGGQTTAESASQPGEGLGAGTGGPDPISKYKWWLLGSLALFCAVAAGVLLRTPSAAPGTFGAEGVSIPVMPGAPHFASPEMPEESGASMLSGLKEDLFTLERKRASGTLESEAYTAQKAALESALKHALKRRN